MTGLIEYDMIISIPILEAGEVIINIKNIKKYFQE